MRVDIDNTKATELIDIPINSTPNLSSKAHIPPEANSKDKIPIISNDTVFTFKSSLPGLITSLTGFSLINKIKGSTNNFHIYTFGGLKETNRWLENNNYA